MATGYTYAITEGEGISFEQYAIGCSRAFLARMRDVSVNEDPEQVYLRADLSSGAESKLKEWEDRLQFLSKMTVDQAVLETEKEYNEEVAVRKKIVEESKDKELKYNAMLDKVLAWEPPTEDHRGLKNFMITQLRDSIQFDCNTNFTPVKKEDWNAWLESNLKSARSQVDYYKKNLAESKVNEGLIWIQKLKASLKETK